MKAVKPAPTRPSLTLNSGEELTADVIIGADGVLVEGNLCRTAVMQAIGQEDEQIPTGLQLFKYVHSSSSCVQTRIGTDDRYPC